MAIKNCAVCNFYDFSKNCEKLEKSQFLLTLIKSRVGEGIEGCPAKTGISAISPKNCEK